MERLTIIMDIIDKPSQNFGAREKNCKIDILLLHYTGMQNCAEALDRLLDPFSEVSAHYVINEDGMIFRLVEEKFRAWHAGISYWKGETDINSVSIGIELVNPGHEFGYREFPKKQMLSLIKLSEDICSRRRIPNHRVLGHSDVAPLRKKDPGELFDWSYLAEAGIGYWPKRKEVDYEFEVGSIREWQADLKKLGYQVDTTGRLDANTQAVVIAFQRHWLPHAVSGNFNRETAWMLNLLLNE